MPTPLSTIRPVCCAKGVSSPNTLSASVCGKLSIVFTTMVHLVMVCPSRPLNVSTGVAPVIFAKTVVIILFLCLLFVPIFTAVAASHARVHARCQCLTDECKDTDKKSPFQACS